MPSPAIAACTVIADSVGTDRAERTRVVESLRSISGDSCRRAPQVGRLTGTPAHWRRAVPAFERGADLRHRDSEGDKTASQREGGAGHGPAPVGKCRAERRFFRGDERSTAAECRDGTARAPGLADVAVAGPSRSLDSLDMQ